MQLPNSLKRPAFGMGQCYQTPTQLLIPQRFPQDLNHMLGEKPCLAYGRGGSYGDCCLAAPETVLVDTQRLNHFIHFDREQQLLTCQAGVTLREILQVIVPQGFCLPVLPGHAEVTVGGAIAGDVHGKNHAKMGSFGHHVAALGLWQAPDDLKTCSSLNHPELFAATIGGLGLTGIIAWAQLRLQKILNTHLVIERFFFRGFAEYMALTAQWCEQFDYFAAWFDTFAPSHQPPSGILFCGKWDSEPASSLRYVSNTHLVVPKSLPRNVLTPGLMRWYNRFYKIAQTIQPRRQKVSMADFFTQLNVVAGWNHLYGPQGFYQYQVAIPHRHAEQVLREMQAQSAQLNMPANLAVLKNLGDQQPAGMLSFPLHGITVALDFSYHPEIEKLLNRFDTLVAEAGGRVYMVKDRRLPAARFAQMYGNLNKFQVYQHPRMRSRLAQRLGLLT